MASGKREGKTHRKRLRGAKPRAGPLSRVFLRLHETADRDETAVIGERDFKLEAPGGQAYSPSLSDIAARYRMVWGETYPG